MVLSSYSSEQKQVKETIKSVNKQQKQKQNV